MNNSLLRHKVSELEAQLQKIEWDNNELRSEISDMVRSVNETEKVLVDYNEYIQNTLDNAKGTINNSINRAIDAYELQGEIDSLYRRYKSVELANKRIRALNNKKFYDFYNYRTVRKIVQAMMDNLDLNMVSDRVIYKAIEREHLKTPDYWLTCVLISTMAWKNDDRLLAERAIENAVKLDKKNSSIFYMIFNLRMGRDDAAVKWFMQYQQCELKGSDENTFLMLFSLISKTLSSSVEEETEIQIKQFITNVIAKSARKKGYTEADIINIINSYMVKLVEWKSFDFPLLTKYCKAYNSLNKMLNLANNNFRILEFILKIKNVNIEEKNTYLKDFLNELLAKPNSNEIDTYEEIGYNELIIRLSGDINTAKMIYEDEKKKENAELDLVSCIIDWIYNFSTDKINGQMRLNMFTLIVDFEEKAALNYFEGYRNMYSTKLPIEINDYSADVDFSEEVKELENITSFYDEKSKEELSKIKNIPAYIAMGAGGALCIAAYLSYSLLSIAGIACVLGGLILFIINSKKAKNILLKNKEKRRISQEVMKQLFKEFKKLEVCYNELDAVSEKIREEFAKL